MPRTSTSSPSSSASSSSSTSKHYTFSQPRTLTVKQHRHFKDPSDYHVKDLVTGEILFFKPVHKLSLYSSSILTRIGTHIPWPGLLIYRVHSGSSMDSHILRHLKYRRHGRSYSRFGGHQRRSRGNMLFISDAISGDVIYTLRTRRRRWSLMSWMSCFRSFFDFHNNHNDDSEGNNPASTEEEIAVWKGPSTSGRPHLVLSGSLHDMNFDILTTTTTSSNTQQRQEIRGRRRGGGGSVVGVVSKYLFDMRETLHDNGRYGVHVQAGYDSALFVLLAIIVDELYHHHHHPGSAPASTYDNVVGRKAGRGEEHSVVMESTTTTERSDSMVSAEEESLPMALALDHIMSLSVGESFSDNEDRLRGEAGKLQEHLTDTSNSSL